MEVLGKFLEKFWKVLGKFWRSFGEVLGEILECIFDFLVRSRGRSVSGNLMKKCRQNFWVLESVGTKSNHITTPSH